MKVEKIINMTNTQQGILYQSLLNTGIYDEIVCFVFRDKLDVTKVKDSWNEVAKNNMILRTIVKWRKTEKPVMIVFDKKEVEIKDYAMVDSVEDVLEEEEKKGIDIEKSSFRIALCNDSLGNQYMILVGHHIFLDGWSSSLLMTYFGKAYSGENIEHHNDYGDYLFYQKNVKKTCAEQGSNLDETYRKMFLPYFRERENNPRTANERLDQNACNHLATLQNKENVSTAAICYSVWYLFLRSYNQHPYFGITCSGRYFENRDFNDVIGLFMHTLPFTIPGNDITTLQELYSHVYKRIVEMESNQDEFSMQNMSKKNAQEFNSICVVENYPFQKENDFSIHRVIEKTHYDCVVQFHFFDGIEVKMISNGTYEIKKILDNFMKFFIRLLCLSTDAKVNDVVDHFEHKICVVSPFELLPFLNRMNSLNSIMNRNVQVDTLDLRNMVLEELDGYDYVYIMLGIEYLIEGREHYGNAIQLLFAYLEKLAVKSRHFSVIKLEGVYPGEVVNESIVKYSYEELETLCNRYKIEMIRFSDRITLKGGVEQFLNKLKYQEANIPFEQTVYNILADTVYRNLFYKNNKQYKVIVLDCDNTLWDGIASEGEITVMKKYIEFQNFLKKKQQEGFLLAICSKNYEETVAQVFEKFEMPLKWNDFVSMKINWEKKSSNIEAISRELNLATNSFIFIDDSIHECLDVIENIPDAFTIQFPTNCDHVVAFMDKIWAFDAFMISNEDKNRTRMYQQQVKRNRVVTEDISETLNKLDIQVSLARVNHHTKDRISQLSYRTNQCNLNGKKIEIEEIEKLIGKDNHYVISAKDEFGEYGIVGYIRYEIMGKNIWIQNMFISCRILGKYLEYAILKYLCDQNPTIETIMFDFVDTGKNRYAARFLENISGENSNGCDKTILYKKEFAFLANIDCIEKEIIVKYKNCLMEFPNLGLGAGEEEVVEQATSFLDAIESLDWSKFISLIYFDAELKKERKPENHNECKLEVNQGIYQRLLVLWNDLLGGSKENNSSNFYDAGGTSLKAMELVSRIYRVFQVTLNVTDILKYPDIKEIASLIEGKKDSEDTKIPHLDQESFCLSPLAESIYAMHEISDNTVMNLPYLFQIEGTVDVAKLEECINVVVSNNRIFRTRYMKENEKIFAKILDQEKIVVQRVRFSGTLDEQFIYTYVKRFDLKEDQLLKCFYFESETGKDQYILFDFHHIIMDGQSLSILMDEINRLYQGEAYPDKKCDYYDYIEWYQQNNLVPALEDLHAFWKKELADGNRKVGITEGVTNHQNYEGAVYPFDISAELTEKIRKASMRYSTSDFVYLLTIYHILLYKCSGEKNCNVGIPISCRTESDMLGLLVNTVTMKSNVDSGTDFQTNLLAVRNRFLSVMENSEIPLQKVLENMQTDSLFEAMFVFNNIEFGDFLLGDSKLSKIPFYHQVAQKPIILEIIDDGKEFHCNFTYRPKVFSSELIKQITNSFLYLIESVLEDDEIIVKKVELVDFAERERIQKHACGELVKNKDSRLIDLFHSMVEEEPYAAALIHNDRKFSYQEVNRLANHLAGYMKKLGVKERQNIVFVPDSSLCAAVGILATMKCGAVYIPVLNSTPIERMKTIVEVSQADFVFANDVLEGKNVYKYSLEEENCPNIDSNTNGGDLAYIIFTSGTTGTSKGVMVQNAAIVNSIAWRIDEYRLSRDGVSILLLGLAFDGFMTAFFTPLLSGQPLVLIDDNRDGKNIVEKIMKYQVTNFIATPTLYSHILTHLSEESRTELKTVVLAGESVSAGLVKKSHKVLPAVEIANEYGPTENSVVSSCKRYMTENTISVGIPIYNCQIEIRNVDENICPIGIKGEVYLGGDSLAKGYLGDQENTDRVFDKSSGKMWYETGDIGIWNTERELCIVGRKGSQCKINGHRVDLAEIEKNIMHMEKVKFCTVINHTTYRCYYFADDFISHKEFVDALSKYLPYYFIPNEFIRIRSIPMNQNGKKEEQILEKLSMEEESTNVVDLMIQEKVLEGYRKALQIEDITCEQNFFSLGGNSMHAIQLQEFLEKELHVKIPVIDFFSYPTVDMLTENIVSYIKGNTISKGKNVFENTNRRSGKNDFRYSRHQIRIERKQVDALSDQFGMESDYVLTSMIMLFLSELTRNKKLNCLVQMNQKQSMIEYDFQEDLEVEEYLHDIVEHYYTSDFSENVEEYLDSTVVISDQYYNVRNREMQEMYVYIQKNEDAYQLIFDVNTFTIYMDSLIQLLNQLVTVLNMDVKEWI